MFFWNSLAFSMIQRMLANKLICLLNYAWDVGDQKILLNRYKNELKMMPMKTCCAAQGLDPVPCGGRKPKQEGVYAVYM